MTRPKTAIGISYLDSIRELPRLLDPIYEHFDLVIGIDGVYPLFKHPTNYSTDGSTELLQKKYNAITYVYKEPVEQIRKRQTYLDIAMKEGCEFLCVHDTDEYIMPEYQNWDLFYKNLENLPDDVLLANMWVWIKPEWIKNHNAVEDNTFHQYPKIYRPDQIKYDTTHYTFTRRDDDNHNFIYAQTVVDGVRYTTDSLLRTPEYIDAGYNWAEAQIQQEAERMRHVRGG